MSRFFATEKYHNCTLVPSLNINRGPNLLLFIKHGYLFTDSVTMEVSIAMDGFQVYCAESYCYYTIVQGQFTTVYYIHAGFSTSFAIAGIMDIPVYEELSFQYVKH